MYKKHFKFTQSFSWAFTMTEPEKTTEKEKHTHTSSVNTYVDKKLCLYFVKLMR